MQTTSGIIILLFCAGWVRAAGPAVAPVKLTPEPPVAITRIDAGTQLVDFGRVAFGNLKLRPPVGSGAAITVHFGEASRNGRVNRKPPGSVRYAAVKATLGSG